MYEPVLWYFDLLLFTADSETGRKDKSNDKEELQSDVDLVHTLLEIGKFLN